MTTTLMIEGIEKNLRDTQFEKDNTKKVIQQRYTQAGLEGKD